MMNYLVLIHFRGITAMWTVLERKNPTVPLLFHLLGLCSKVASHFIGMCCVGRGQPHICFKDTDTSLK